MTIAEINARLKDKIILTFEQDGEQYTTDYYIYDNATADPTNGRWCYVHKLEGRTELVSRALLEELAERGIITRHGSNVAEIEAYRRAGVFPLPEYVERKTMCLRCG